MTHSQAIILTAPDGIRPLLLLDRFRGKVRPFLVRSLQDQRFMRGALVECAFVDSSSSIVVQVEMCAMPHEWAGADILFFHQVIELCLVFLPEAQEAYEICELLWYLYVPQRVTGFIKKLFLCRLLFLLHVYEEHWVDQELLSLISYHHNSMFGTDENADLEKKATRWLAHVSRLGPSRLKTFGIYYEDVLE